LHHAVNSSALEVPTLQGRIVRLEPIALAHVDGLIEAAAENRASYAYTTVPHGRAEVTAYVRELEAAARRGETFGLAQVRTADDAVVGMTRFLTLRHRPGASHPYAVEIGGTWLAASAQGTGVNVEAKLLLLTHAFDVWKVGRVDFKTDARNERSRAAIAALGAQFEAVLRNWQPSHAEGEAGLLRDSAMYAVVDRDWVAVRTKLEARVADRVPETRGAASPTLDNDGR
jgi:RimJ/RimL family protein N-acetyltransferase